MIQTREAGSRNLEEEDGAADLECGPSRTWNTHVGRKLEDPVCAPGGQWGKLRSGRNGEALSIGELQWHARGLC